MAKKKPQHQARLRAKLILKVRAGEMTATEAAAQLGVSRKTYYKWEKRGLAAMLEGLGEREPGRPSIEPDPETEALKKKVEELEKELRRKERSESLRELLKDSEKKD